MKNSLLALSLLFGLSACGDTHDPLEKQASQSTQTSASESIINLTYPAYLASANKRLQAAKTNLQIPESAIPDADPSGSKKMFHDFSDGLSVSVTTNNEDKVSEVRIVWDTDTATGKAEQLRQAAAALLAATAPEDRTLERDTVDQIKTAIESHNKGGDPTRTFARGGIAYKVTVTNLPSVVLTAKAE